MKQKNRRTTMKKIVIIGGVAGGASCAARLRRLDGDADIILLERGEYISYANCGLPYHTGDVIKSRDALLLQTPEAMKKKFNVDVRVKNEAVSIDTAARNVTIMNKVSGETYVEAYDELVISTGSSPVKPPIPGIDHHRIMTLWTVPDTDQIRQLIREKGARRAAVIGGGFIGLEMAENLRHAGLEVSLIEALDQVMAPLDPEMARLLQENMIAGGVDLHLSDGVDSFEDKGDSVAVKTKSGQIIEADLVILSIGVRPNSELAVKCGLEVNQRGGIVTDAHLRTSDPHIYAVGDVIEVNDLVFNEPAMIPLAGPANKQGRIAADNICGAEEIYEGTQGTSVAQVFDLTAASTGASEKALIRRGLKKGSDYETIYVTQNSHAGYYPGATPMTIKLLFSKDGKKIYGAQIVGRKGVDKRIDTISTALRLGAGIDALQKLELAYAPPYSSAKDPVNMAGFTAVNLLSGLVNFAEWDSVEKSPQACLLDVREDAELMAYAIEGTRNIPLGQLRSRLSELDPNQEIIVFCAIGVRAYNAARILMQNGFKNVKVYPGGTGFYRSTHYDTSAVTPMGVPPATAPQSEKPAGPVSSIRLDCSGLQCPGPIMKVFEAMKDLAEGDSLEVVASDPGFVRDIDAWCRRTGNTLVSTGKGDDYYSAVVRKGSQVPQSPSVKNSADGKTIIVFDGDLDKVLASFIIANGAAAMGRPVTMFFTFWGLTALRKPTRQPVHKTFMESMFGAMLPRGTGKLKLSKMNMGGMGTAMMKKIMNDKNVDSLETMIEKALQAGVKIVACTMSMDVMGIKAEELIDGVELGGVGAYLGDAEESNVNLFI
jgi:NADPH-dependent 2,4-dienoyl-CoA reductase/sulfur reductase-like enzyme/peroxiredoxin family protein/TusA-related sulfurtransferase/rhodanese-related sulfurtransferase